MDGWVGGWMGGWQAGRQAGRMDGWMDGWFRTPQGKPSNNICKQAQVVVKVLDVSVI